MQATCEQREIKIRKELKKAFKVKDFFQFIVYH